MRAQGTTSTLEVKHGPTRRPPWRGQRRYGRRRTSSWRWSRLHDIVRPYARVVPTGSYYLDLMMFPDIDLYISKVSLDDLFHIGAQLARCERVIQVVFERSRMARLPGGLYLKPRIEYGDWGPALENRHLVAGGRADRRVDG